MKTLKPEQPLTIRVSREVHDKLRRESFDTRTPVNVIVNRLIAAFLKKLNKEGGE